MKNIVVLANNDIGLFKFRKELLIELVKNYKVFVCVPYGEFIDNIESLGCGVIQVQVDRRGTNPFTDMKLFLKYAIILRKISPDIVLTYTIKPNIYGGLVCRMFKIPYITTITGLGTAVENSGLMQKMILFLYKMSLKQAACVYFQNEKNKKFFLKEKIIHGRHIQVPGSGVNLKDYYLLDYPSENKIRFLFIARVMKEKGIDQYLDAAQYIRSKYPYTEFHVLGFCEGQYEAKLQKLHEQNIIRYHGMQKDVLKFYKMAHCIIHPSYYPEGLSNVLLESAACGRVIITTDHTGCKEVVDDTITGYLIKTQNSQDLIVKIERFLQLEHKDKKEMGFLGRKKIEAQFDRRRVVEAYLKQIYFLC